MSQSFLSCGEDGIVCLFDLRASFSPIMQIHVTDENDDSMSVYSVSVNPVDTSVFAAGGSSNRAFLYDIRTQGSLGSLCPSHLLSKGDHITCLKYSRNGCNLIASYNDEHIYSFDVSRHMRPPQRGNTTSAVSGDPDRDGYLQCFKGHRNLQTVKQLNYMGSRDEFIVSGSDCGHVFIWAASSGRVVHVIKGDSVGAVNCLVPHPYLPLLAVG